MRKKFKIKVCGMKLTQNREEVEKLAIDFLGFIFYPESKRFVGENAEPGLFNSTKTKVGVFVNENIYEILGLSKNLGFEFVQLHGKENPSTCKILKSQGLNVIKAFNLNEKFKFNSLKEYEGNVDFFLFDTKTNLPGGSGQKFNWQILDNYKEKTPFFLSGGIQPEDAGNIKKISHLQFAGIDLNSGFENAPGEKNIEKLKNFISELKS
jgi:phosphoribosylanthranilate isomerase